MLLKCVDCRDHTQVTLNVMIYHGNNPTVSAGAGESSRQAELSVSAHTADIKATTSLQILLREQTFPKLPPAHLFEGPNLEKYL